MVPYIFDLTIIAISCIALGISIAALILNHDTRDEIERCSARHEEEKRKEN